MARTRRFTVRLDEREFATLNGYAERRHVLPSVALRALIAIGSVVLQARRDDRGGQKRGDARQT
jgi:hypothetical protein